MAPTTKKFAKNKVHFVGIGGIGMSALARWYLAQKWLVTGSDLVFSSLIHELEKEGAKIKIGHSKENLDADVSLVVYSAAVPRTNPELQEAGRRGLEMERYSQALGGLTRSYTAFAVCGSHGKTTTTALLALSAIQAGLDPTVIIGTKLREFGNSNFRLGKGTHFIFEADEWGASFLDYTPAAIIITSVDKEHLDFYKTFENVQKAFLKFITRIKKEGNGLMVVNADDPGLSLLREKIEQSASSHGIKVLWYSLSLPQATSVRRALKIRGEHNVSNALAAYALLKAVGVSHRNILAAFRRYRGSWRRMEYKGKFQIPNSKFQNPVYDDYAHHPTEIRATLKAFKELFPKRPIVCVYQPHQVERLRLLFSDFIDAFQDAWYALLLPVYQVAGRERTKTRRTAQALVRAIQKKYPKARVSYLADPKDIRIALSEIIQSRSRASPPAVIVMMGAGDIFEYTNFLICK